MEKGRFKFENLKVWERAIRLANDVHVMTRDWPKEELYILTSQIKRAADSISLNIAEGYTGQSNAEFKRFLGYYYRYALELVNCFYLAKGRNLINSKLFDQQYVESSEIIKTIFGLKNSIK